MWSAAALVSIVTIAADVGYVSPGAALSDSVAPAPPDPPAVAAQDERYRERQVLDPESDEWKPLPPDAERPAGVVDQARRALATGKPQETKGLLDKWVKQNKDDDRILEAHLLLGEAYFQMGEFWKAYESFEVVAESGAGELFYRALRREMDVARAFFSGKKRNLWGFIPLPAYDDGVEILDKVFERAPGTRLGEDALKLKADFLYERGDMDLAQDEYVTLVREYPSGRYTQTAMLRSAEAADASFPGVKFDDRPLVEAEERYKQVKATFPAYAERERVDARLDGIRAKRAEKDLDIGRWYERTNRPQAAEYYYRAVLRDWSGTVAATEARGRLRAMGLAVDEAAEGGG